MEDRPGSIVVQLLLLVLIALELRPVLTRASCDYGAQNCGNAPVPYPFGMQEGCGLPNYRILCKENASFGAGEFPFLQLPSNASGKIHEFQVISFNTSSLIINVTHVRATDACNPAYQNYSKFSIASDMPFAVSPTNNIFAAIGCTLFGRISTAADSFNGGYSECTTSCYVCLSQPCYKQSDLYSFCSPPGCCMIALYTVPAKIVEMWANEGNPKNDYCGFSAVFDPDTNKTADNHTWGFPNGQYGLNLIWGLPLDGPQNCFTVKDTTAYACSPYAECLNVNNLPGYVCNCSREGYHGDGYFNGTGCKDINECSKATDNVCVEPPYGYCTNTDGSYRCSCINGATGDGTKNGTRCTKNTIPATVIIPVSVLSTAAALAITGFSALWIYKARTSKIRKAKYFAKNGGIRLQEYIFAATGSSTEAPRLYTEAELQKATGNFSQDLQLGRGGYGTVYKGILSDHTTVVAIKKSNHTIEDHESVDQFINEIIILSQVNHRNIVKLLGCCLETVVPLLVYEYISNGTLFEHLHGKDGRFLSWESRLVIALESAQALAYLHSYASTPIFHRDIKSSNILLDVSLTAKVSDFGISRLLPMGNTHISTVVHGTMGYLDPEYFKTLQLTEKSDVYSFGVVLLELITSLKPIAMEREEEDSNLAMLCISRWTTGTFSRLIDPGLRASENPHLMQSINQVAKLAISCLHAEGRLRPSMKEVFEILLWVRGSKGALSFMQAHIEDFDNVNEAERPLIPTWHKESEKASSSDPSGRLLGLEMANSLKMEGGR